MSIYKELIRRREELKKKLLNKNSPSLEQYDLYKSWINSRKVESIDQFPDYIKEKINFIKAFITLSYPAKEAKLIGSYYKGDWIDEKSSEEEKEIKRTIKHKDKISDFDIQIPGVKSEIIEVGSIKIHIIPFTQEKGFLIINDEQL